jgi:hypothetical protein
LLWGLGRGGVGVCCLAGFKCDDVSAPRFGGRREMAWAVDLMEKGLNPARHIKGGDAVLEDGE